MVANQEVKTKNVLHLVRREPDSSIIEYLKALLEQAERGAILGVVAAVHYGSDEFGYVGAGSLVDNSVLGLGAMLRLSQKLL